MDSIYRKESSTMDAEPTKTPEMVISTESHSETGSQSGSEATATPQECQCNICYESFDVSETVTLQCADSHTFGKGCITKWYNSTVRTNQLIPNDKIYACPICRQYGGIGVLEDICAISFGNIKEKMNEYSITKCLCKTNLDQPYGNSTYCLHQLHGEDQSQTYQFGAMIEFPAEESGPNKEIRKIALCHRHYIDYKIGNPIYHYCKQKVVKDPSNKVTENIFY